MPEGDTLYRIAATLRAALAGARILCVATREPAWHALVAGRPLVERAIVAIEARGKHLLIVCRDASVHEERWLPGQRLGLDLCPSDRIVQTHLGMRGSWWLDPPSAGGRVLAPRSVHFDTTAGSARCQAPRQFRILTPRELGRSDVAALGPDLTRDDLQLAMAAASFAGVPELQLGEAMLRQQVVAGIGNVVKSEALFLAGVSPFARVATVPPAMLAAVLAHASTILVANRTGGGRRRTVPAAVGAPHLWVYGRTGHPCLRCGTAIVSRLQGADVRRTYFCPSCQAVDGD